MSGHSVTDPSRHRAELTLAFEPASSRILTEIAESVGGIPRVLLRDTDIETNPGPILKPSSSEMPGLTERPEKYQFFGEIARGGMGAVLRGRDVDLGRELAVKVLLEAHKDKPELVKRFVEEAQIGGQLQHPGVVPVYELGGFADRRPFFTMKLVKGRTLAEMLSSRSSPGTELPRFLSIFESIAQTMAYSHSRGVIHRDLKPSNVMVGSFGEVQVMDWGLAKVLPQGRVVADESEETPKPAVPVSLIQTARSGSDVDASVMGSVLGTPGYMAPEQARGEIAAIDERADVFGLGAILCAILTGAPAFVGRNASETLRKAGRGELADACARLDACGAEVELIALAKECVATERDDRPATARQVSDRITAYLTGVQERLRQTELARVEASARAEEERKRHKLTLALAAAVLALVTLGGGGTAMYLQQRQEQAGRLELALRESSLLRNQALADPDGDPMKWQRAVETLKRADDLLGPLIATESHRRVRALSDEVVSASRAAERDAKLVRDSIDIRSAEADDPDGSASDAGYAAAFRAAGLDIDTLGPEAAALEIRSRPKGVVLQLTAAVDDWASQRRRARPKDTDGWKRLVATVRGVDPDPIRDRLRQVWSESDRKAQREPLLKLASEADPRSWPSASMTLLADALAEAGERNAAALLLLRAQAEHPSDVWVSYNLAAMLERVNPPRTEEAIRFYSVARALRPETAHELAHALKRRDRSDEAMLVFRDLTKLRPGNGRHWGCLSVLLTEHGDRPAAGKAIEKAVAIQREAIRLKPDDDAAHLSLGIVLCDAARDYAAAIAEFREVIRLKPDSSVAHRNLGIALRRQGKLDEAVAAIRSAIQLHPDTADAHDSLATALLEQGKSAEGIAELRAAIQLDPDSADRQNNLGHALAGQGKLAEAIAAFQAAIRLKPDFAEAHNNLGLVLTKEGKTAEAIDAYRAAIRIKPGLSEAHMSLGALLCNVMHDYAAAAAEYRAAIRKKPDYAAAHSGLGVALQGQGNLAEAIAECREAIRLDPDQAQAHYNLGRGLAEQGKSDEAIASYRQAIRLKPNYAEAHTNLGQLLREKGKLVEAIAEYRMAIQFKPELAVARMNLANALNVQGNFAEANAAYREEIRLRPNDAAVWYNFGLALANQGKADEAMNTYREAIRLNPDYAEAHCNLGWLLQEKGELREALAQLRRGHELGSKQSRWRYPSDEWVRRAESMVALESRLPAVLRGAEKPKDALEWMGFAEIAFITRQFGQSARLYAEAIGADPHVFEDVAKGRRYAAACAAALAGAGKGDDTPPPTEPEKSRWRKHAVDWLEADLTYWIKQAEIGKPEAKALMSQKLLQWKADSDLAGIRDASALAALPEAEQKACRALWAKVDKVLAGNASR
jgi:eukaryotic-like serine/threonine-protein kinase